LAVLQSPQLLIRPVSQELYRWGSQSVDCLALTDTKDTHMDIIAIEIGATAVLLVAHLAIVVRNRLFSSR
jgi:hypothetical protein